MDLPRTRGNWGKTRGEPAARFSALGAAGRQELGGEGPKHGRRHGPGRPGDLANLDTAALLQHLPSVRFPAEKEQIASTAENIHHSEPSRSTRCATAVATP